MENNNFNMNDNDLKDLGFFDFEPQGKNQHASIPFGFNKNGIVALDLDEGKDGGILALAKGIDEIEALQESILLMGCMKYSPSDLRVMAIGKGGSLLNNLKKWDFPHTISTICVGNYYDFTMALENLLNFIKRREQRLQALGKINGTQLTSLFEFNKIVTSDRKNPIVPMERALVFIDEVCDIIDSAKRESERDAIAKKLADVILRGKSVGVYVVAGAVSVEQSDCKIIKAISPYVRTLCMHKSENGLEAELSSGVGLPMVDLENDKGTWTVKLAKYDTLQREEYVSAIKDNYYFFQNN